MIVGQDGPAVVLSAETAYWLETVCRVSALRMRLRDGRHQQVSQELLDLRHVAMSFDPSRLPENAEVGRTYAEVRRDSDRWMSVADAADLLDIGDRAVRLACQQGRLDGELVRGRWRIRRQAIEDFKRGGTAA
jgi:excisionase family DNA binding protein